jgi:hypothetical protein
VSSPKAKTANHPLVVGNRRRRVERVVRDKVYANLLTGSRALRALESPMAGW